MDLATTARLGLLFAHLMLCVFALQSVLSTDWQLLRSRISARQLHRGHKRMVGLLAGLWLTGLLIVALDTGFVAAEVLGKPKLIAKLVCVSLLTLNGFMLRLWCFPRLISNRVLSRPEAMVLMVCGGMSTMSWLMAAFYGIAKPMQSWTLLQCLTLYGLAFLAMLPVALALEGRLRDGRLAQAASKGRHRSPDTSAAAPKRDLKISVGPAG